MIRWKTGVICALVFSMAMALIPVRAEDYVEYEEDWEYDDSAGDHDYSEEEEHEDDHAEDEDGHAEDEDGHHAEACLLSPDEKALSDARWEEDIQDLPSYVSLDLPEIWQMPEMPTGCEPVAMTIAIDYMGFDLDKETFARKYLRYSAYDMADGFMGDPFKEDGAGILPPALAESCNDYFKSQGSDLTAFETSSFSFGELLALTAKGYPVLIWVTTDYEDPEIGHTSVSRNGIDYQWYINEHCVVIQGYNLDTGRIVFSDPSCGYIGQNLNAIRYLYESIGGYSLAISSAKG